MKVRMKSKTIKKKKLPKKRTNPKHEAWNAFSLYIRELDKWVCCTCGWRNVQNKENDRFIHAGHVISRSRASTLYDEDNVFAQCEVCNYTNQFSPEVMTAWYLKAFGEARYLNMVQKSRMVCQRKRADYLTIAAWFKEKLSALRMGNIPHRQIYREKA